MFLVLIAQYVLWSSRWAVEGIQCIKQLILLQPTAVKSTVVLLKGSNICYIHILLFKVVNLNLSQCHAGTTEEHLRPNG